MVRTIATDTPAHQGNGDGDPTMGLMITGGTRPNGSTRRTVTLLPPCSASNGTLNLLLGCCRAVISQTHWLVSQERLSPRTGTSIFIDLFPITLSGKWWF